MVHQNAFCTDVLYRTVESIQRLLAAILAEEANEIEQQKQEVLRIRLEAASSVTRRHCGPR